jgi:hypothetical protein
MAIIIKKEHIHIFGCMGPFPYIRSFIYVISSGTYEIVAVLWKKCMASMSPV